LAAEFHLIALDLRGHGGSAKPTDPENYSAEVWAGDIAAVIAATTAQKPVLVPWSMGGTVTFAYVKHNGVTGIAGINFVAAAAVLSEPPAQTEAEKERAKAFSARLMGMLSPDMAANIAATRWFVGALTKDPLPAAEQERIFAYNMTTPAYVRQAMFARGPIDFRDQPARVTVPALFSHGDADGVVAYVLSVDNARRLPNAKLSTYAGIGHAPFLEDPARFNRELADFVRAAQR
jgi:pimeloyl-ACP methyl ester carboxylesterase